MSGRLSRGAFLVLELMAGWGDGAREESGELSDNKPEVKRGEYCANMTEHVVKSKVDVVEDNEQEGRGR